MSRFSPDMNHDPDPEIYALLAQHQGAIRGYILSLTADPHLTNDVLQETNLVVCKKGAEFEPGSNFVGWACRVAYFEVLRSRANTRRDKLVFDDSLLETIAEQAEAECQKYALRKQALSHCLQQLGAHNKQLILQRYFENVPLDQVAQKRGSTANSISQLLYRLRQKLMRCIERTQVENQKI